jgi:SHS family lactate transporter-like MFS transporter
MAAGVLSGWTPAQKHVTAAAYLGWTLDALDFFLLVFVFADVAAEFHTSVPVVAGATSLTLAFRPLGAFIFGRLADKFGRRPILMANIAFYSVLSFSTAFVPDLTTFLIVRAVFGIGMGGVWGIGSSLAMETIKPQARGFVSGLLQSGYCSGYIIASIVFGLLYVHVGWRGMFMVGIVPSFLLIPYIWATVPESPIFNRVAAAKSNIFKVLREHWRLTLYTVLMMTCFNFFSHGTGDLYPTFLRSELHQTPATIGTISVLFNIGGVFGCWLVAPLSQRFGRRRTMIVGALMVIPCVYPWAFGTSLAMLTIGAILVNFFVQGAWSVIPAYLNEMSPREARGTFPGTVYQLGNLFASYAVPMQAIIAQRYSYGIALASVAVCACIAVSLFIWGSREAHSVDLAHTA